MASKYDWPAPRNLFPFESKEAQGQPLLCRISDSIIRVRLSIANVDFSRARGRESEHIVQAKVILDIALKILGR